MYAPPVACFHVSLSIPPVFRCVEGVSRSETDGLGIWCVVIDASPLTCAPAISDIVSPTFLTMPPSLTKQFKYNKNHNIFGERYTSELKAVRDISSNC